MAECDSAMSAEMSDTWNKFMDSGADKNARKFLRLFLSRGKSASLTELPDELLPALSKFLLLARDDIEQSSINAKSICEAKDVVKTLILLTGNVDDNIPLVSSMDLIRLVTQCNSSLLKYLLEMESSFFVANKAKMKAELQKLRAEILDFISQSLRLLECIYDPYRRWKSFLEDEEGWSERLQSSPVALQQEVIPFLYESFETALTDCFPSLAEQMLHVFGAVVSGARHNAIRAISPATSKMLLKTIR